MNKQKPALILKKLSDKGMAPLLGILPIAMSLTFSMTAFAQNYSQDSALPPEVIPINTATTYNAAKSLSSTASVANIPGIETSQISQAFQTPQEARQALYHSLMGTNTYPQFAGQAFNQDNSLNGNNMNTGNAFNQGQGSNQGPLLGQNMAQASSDQMQSTQIAQNNMPVNPTPAQTQTLSGSVATQNTAQQRTTGGISRATGAISGMGMNAYALSGMRSPGGIYSAGLLGASLMNYGLRSGFKF